MLLLKACGAGGGSVREGEGAPCWGHAGRGRPRLSCASRGVGRAAPGRFCFVLSLPPAAFGSLPLFVRSF